ncbi:MAG: hypothetical protein AAF787_00965 [Chloroflexota bacterium]
MFKFNNRVLTLIVALAVMLGAVAGVAAQEDTFGLSPEDFAFWGEANAASTDFTALEFTYLFDTIITAEGDSFAGNIGGTGVITEDAASFTIIGNLDEVGPVDAELRFVDNQLFVGGIMGPDVWVSFTEEDLNTITELGNEQLPFDTEALAQGDVSELGLDEAQQQEALFAVLTLFESIADYAVVTRDGDTFVAEFLLDEFVQDPSVQTLIELGVESQAAEGEDVTAQVQEINAGAVLATAGSELSYTQVIDPSTGLVQQGTFILGLGGANLPFELGIELDVTLDAYETSQTVEAPAEALPFGQLMQMGGM